jgi:hypothetical protein
MQGGRRDEMEKAKQEGEEKTKRKVSERVCCKLS